jgi:hypothetical protein
MKNLTEFTALPYSEKIELVKVIFAELGQHYDYFKDLHTYMIEHETDINEEFLLTSYDLVFKFHQKLEK